MKKSSFIPQKPKHWKFKKDLLNQIGETGGFIYHIGESDALRKPSIPVAISEISSDQFKRKITYLKRCITRYRKITKMGRGITGVQIGIPQRFAVIYMGKFQKAQKIEKKDLLIIINPKITKRSQKLLEYPEICMSANPLIASVVRPSWIEFEYLDEKGKKQVWNLKDHTNEGKVFNRVFQHEIDHIDGIICIDRVESKSIVFESDPKFYEKAIFKEVFPQKNSSKNSQKDL